LAGVSSGVALKQTIHYLRSFSWTWRGVELCERILLGT
jgi:hypothetical protein